MTKCNFGTRGNMKTIQELDTVALTCDLPAQGL